MGSQELTDDEIEALLQGDKGDKGNKGSNGDQEDNSKNFIEEDIGPKIRKKQVQNVDFSEIEDNSSGMRGDGSNLGLLMDVPLEVSVEIGRTRKSVQEILSLNVGSVIELNKLSGEPVDLLVNGKIIAKAEIVVIDENFGIRITEIIKPKSRIGFE